MSNRRNFIKQSSITGLGLSLAAPGIASVLSSEDSVHKYKMKFAPHLGMFKNQAGEDPVDEINFMAKNGLSAFEDNQMKERPIEEQTAIAKALKANDMHMGVFVAHKIYWKEANLASGKKEWREEFLEDIKESIAVAKRVNAKWMTVVPGHLDLSKDIGYQTQNIVETLRLAADILEPEGLVMVLEPLNFRDHPGMFLSKASQAYQICKAVGSPSCKILFDIYHQQVQEGNLIPNIEACWDEIAYFQIGDNPGRNEPTTGEINYNTVFKYIHEKGYDGILGMEHGISLPGEEGEQAVLEAYYQLELNIE